AQTSKALKISRRETSFRHQTGGSSKGAGSKLEVLDEPKGKSVDISERSGSKPKVLDVSKVMSSDQESENESWGDSEDDDDDHQSDNERTESDDDKNIDLNRTNDEEETQEDEFVHTPDDYVPTDDETQDVDDEVYVRINEELYGDVNVEMKDAEHADEGKGDEEITDVRVSDLEKEVKELRNFDHSTTLLATIKSEVPIGVKEYLGTNLGDTLHKSILADEDAMNQGVADLDKQKKRKHVDGDRDEDPPAGSNQGLKKRKTRKDTEPPKRPKLTSSSKDSTRSQPKLTSKFVQSEETIFEAADTEMTLNQGNDMGEYDEQPDVEAAPKLD
ncbi:hypothetical protein Tco_1281375, partial [Tanacetum coccineum]